MGPKRLQYSEESMNAALLSIKEKKMGLSEAAYLHGVPSSTLYDRLKGTKAKREICHTALSDEYEQKLVSWLEQSAKRGFIRTRKEVRDSVQRHVKDSNLQTPFKDGRPGKKWMSGFMTRHKEELSIMTRQNRKSPQKAALAIKEIKGWFDKAYQEIMAVAPGVFDQPERIFNCTETGFQLNGGVSKTVVPIMDKDSQKQVTVLACGNAAGKVHPPLLNFPGQRFNFNPLAGFPEAHFSKSVHGWIDSGSFAAWLRTFVQVVADLEKPVILFVGGHRSHLSLGVSELCRDHNIILYQLPSYPSHMIHPLDLTTFKDLTSAWSEEVTKYEEEMHENLGKKDFSHVFKKVWKRGMQKDVVISGFRAAGIYPWDPNNIDLSKFGQSKLTYSYPSSSTETCEVPMETEEQTETMAVTETPQTSDDNDFDDDDSEMEETPEYPSHDPSAICSPDLPASTSSSQNALPPVLALERLLDVSARCGLKRLSHLRKLHTLRRQTDDPDEQLFMLLYDRLTYVLATDNSIRLPNTNSGDKTNNKVNGNQVPKTEQMTDDQPEMMHGTQRKVVDITEEMRKKKKQMDEKRRAEQKEKEREEKAKGKPLEQENGEQWTIERKHQKTDNIDISSDSDSSDSQTSSDSDYSDGESDDDDIFIILKICYECFKEADDDVSIRDWVECTCKRWFHVECSMDDRFRGKSSKEIENMEFKCRYCKRLEKRLP